MGVNSKIEWCDHTFNPWIGCTKVSPACDNCYAEAMNNRFAGGNWGPKAQRRMTSAANWKKPRQWDRQAAKEGRRFRVFCGSMCDIADNAVDQEWRDDLQALISDTPNLDWLLLTKRPQNLLKFYSKDVLAQCWVGTTVENQTEAERRIPYLIDVPSRVRFLSCEPLLGRVDLRAINVAYGGRMNAFMHDRINWVICGGESGPNARPMHPEWARFLRDQCQEFNIAFHFKQWGEYREADDSELPDHFGSECDNFRCVCSNGFIGDISIGSAFLHKPASYPQCFPNGPEGEAVCNYSLLFRSGKKEAGRHIDGRTWDEFPKSEAA